VVSPWSIDRAAVPDRLVVVGELAHGVVHYGLVLRENGWDFSAEILDQAEHHHCQPEFMRLTQQVGNFRRADGLACWLDGHKIGRSQRRTQAFHLKSASRGFP
jgi:hypothetical protein